MAQVKNIPRKMLDLPDDFVLFAGKQPTEDRVVLQDQDRLRSSLAGSAHNIRVAEKISVDSAGWEAVGVGRLWGIRNSGPRHVEPAAVQLLLELAVSVLPFRQVNNFNALKTVEYDFHRTMPL